MNSTSNKVEFDFRYKKKMVQHQHCINKNRLHRGICSYNIILIPGYSSTVPRHFFPELWF